MRRCDPLEGLVTGQVQPRRVASLMERTEQEPALERDTLLSRAPCYLSILSDGTEGKEGRGVAPGGSSLCLG